MFKSLFNFILFLAVLYAAICMLAYFFQEKLLFFPSKSASPQFLLDHFENCEISFRHNDVELHGWLLNPGAKTLIIYFGGNAEEVSGNLPDFQQLSDCSVLLINYRGFGKSSGKPGQDQLFEDSKYIYDQMIAQWGKNTDKIILFGRSLGSGVATYLASQRPVDGIVLVTPYSSIKNVGAHAYPFLPVSLLLKHPFESDKYGKNLEIPALLLIAASDEVIPRSSSLDLAEALGNSTESHIIEPATHNDIQLNPKYWQLIREYLSAF